ncbi:MAG: saccharopine dehydrogenase, partial [Rhodobacteraceae bacterium]|nr:saccharopine dehydrogenase [Paracoccaceae bacterium]
ADLQEGFARSGHARPTVLIIGALGRVGTGAADLCTSMGISPPRWDMAETTTGGPFPQILQHDVFLNCILARPGTPVFVAKSALTGPRILSVIGDISCDPDSDFSPIKVYDQATTWAEPARRVHSNPALDVTAIDNLPSLLPAESSEDFAEQLLPHLATLDALNEGVWSRAKAMFDHYVKGEDQQ